MLDWGRDVLRLLKWVNNGTAVVARPALRPAGRATNGRCACRKSAAAAFARG